MTGRIRRDIIDNSSDVTMRDVLNSEIPHAKQFDVSTGYFDVDGYGLLRENIEKAAEDGSFRMRLLMGKGAMLPSEETFEELASRLDEPRSVKAQLDGQDLELGSYGDAASLIRLLERPNVEVRLGQSRFNHSKCYILGDNSVFIGSSNLTGAGLAGNYELNAGLYQPGVTAQTRNWFDRMWADASDAKEDLMRVLKQSKFGAPAEPHDVYMKMLFEKFKQFLKRPDRPHRRGALLTAFQQDAVDTAMHLIGSYGGAIIADSTGLGKTNMGIEIIRQKILNEGKKAMLVAPAQVLDSMWGAKLREVDIAVRQTASMESMGREGFLDGLHKYRNIDFVLIDESQNFRSKNAQRRINLMRMLSVGRPKQVLLLTATPINNSLMDLYYQLSIITKDKKDYFWETVGIVDLHKHMRDATNKDLSQGLEKIQQLLDSVMIRRTRSFIRDVYKDDKIDGKPISFPKHEYRPIRYDLAEIFGDIFGRLFEDIKSLTMAPYGLERYNEDLPKDEREAHRTLAHLQVLLLLKRFESSTEAVRISIGNKIRMYEHVERMLKQDRILRVRDFNRAIARWSDDETDGHDPEEDLARMVQEAATEKLGSGYDKRSMLSDMGSDLQILRNLLKELEKVTIDKKFEAVRDAIVSDGALEKGGRKVLVFTEYTATATHLYEKMREAFPGKEVLLIHGNTKQEVRQRHIGRFSPKANPSEDQEPPDKEADILVSTEVLSEGQNLQDCNYVVNYDLPWNPMRIVQRTGRIDRLTSTHKTVHSRACYPDKQLDALLNLIGKLLAKVDMAASVVGTDMEILGKMPSPKKFNESVALDIRALAGRKGDSDATIARLESESDLMPKSTPINEIMRHVKEIGFEAMGDVPMGRRSGKKGEGRKAVLAYLQEDGQTRRVHFVVYDYAKGRAEVPENDSEAIGLISCAKGTDLYLPMDGEEHRESFEELLRIDAEARGAIRDMNEAGKKKVLDLKKKSQSDLDLNVLVEAVVGGRLPQEDADEAYRILSSHEMGPWTGTVKDILREYEPDPPRMCREIRQLADRIYLEDRAVDKTAPVKADSQLMLVGAMFVMDGEPAKGLKPSA